MLSLISFWVIHVLFVVKINPQTNIPPSLKNEHIYHYSEKALIEGKCGKP